MTEQSDLIERWRELQSSYLATATALDKALAEQFELSLSEFEILDLIAEAATDECRMRDLVDLTPMTQSALSRIVDRLQKSHLVVRKECTDDRRAMFVRFTPEGAAVHGEARKVYLGMLDSQLA